MTPPQIRTLILRRAERWSLRQFANYAGLDPLAIETGRQFVWVQQLATSLRALPTETFDAIASNPATDL